MRRDEALGEMAGASDLIDCIPIGELATKLQLSRSQIYTLCREGKFPHARLGVSIRFPRRLVERWLEAQCRVEEDRPRARVDRLDRRARTRRSARR